MGMAQRTADFLSANLFYPDGSAVQCIIADICIGGVAESAQTAEMLRHAGVGVSITVTPCWCYGSETMDMDPHLPKAVWGFNGTKRLLERLDGKNTGGVQDIILPVSIIERKSTLAIL
jgi:L-fucose isomerase